MLVDLIPFKLPSEEQFQLLKIVSCEDNPDIHQESEILVKARRVYQQSSEYFEVKTAWDLSDDSFFIMDREQRITKANKTFQQLIGLKEELLL